MKVLIHKPNISIDKIHSSNWLFPWIEYCENNHIEYDTIDLLEADAINVLRSYDVLLWHFGQYSYSEMLEARSILYCAEQMGLKTFPSFKDSWHFDDKIAEMYALQAVNAPIPNSNVFYNIKSFNEWLNTDIQLPIVAKLRTGSGSHNVKLFKSKYSLKRYAKRMFSKGYNPAPSFIYKTTSNIRSSNSKASFWAKLKRAPEFLRTLKGAKKFPYEKGYVYLQEFIPNDGFDMKIVVVGDKCTGLHRPIRTHDFRASGGGAVLYDKTLFSDNIIRSAFATADALGLKCVGFDYVIDTRTGKGVIVEMSYGFSHTAVMGMNGYFDRNCKWHDGAVNAPQELLKNIIEAE